jgi:hypothetical protein
MNICKNKLILKLELNRKLVNSKNKKKVVGVKILLVFFAFLLMWLFASCLKKESIKIITANSKQATIKFNNKIYPGSWTITPSVSPDIFPVEITKGTTTKVSFLTDLDSINFEISFGDKKDFYVLLNNKDSALTRFEGVPSKVIFTEEYIKKNKGKSSVEIIEAQELIQIISVISPIGLKDTRSRIINHDSTDYYLSVLDYFLPFKNEPIVNQVDSLLQKGFYINLKADACALEFDDNNTLKKTEVYDRMRGSKNLLNPYLDQLNDFVKKSNFRSFFAKNTKLYDSLITLHKKMIPTKRQWDWLETQFPDHHYDNYRITFSPLVKGNHSTVRFNNNNFKQAVMFIRPPYRVKNVNEKVSEGLITRFVFTEIDHNYVNPETDKYIKDVNAIFSNRDKWTAGKESKGYNSPYTIFNEYMTWSVYLLYCYDQYNEEDFKKINDRIINYKINRRGFYRFDDFHSTLLNLYTNRKPGTTIAELYRPLLEWAKVYNPINK